METHVKVLGTLNIICGVLGLCGALLMMLIFGGVVGVVAADGDPDAAIVLPLLGLTGAALVAAILVVSLPGIVIGAGLLRLRPWARVGGIALAALSLLVVPVGTLLGAYGLWVQLSKHTEAVFAQPRMG